MSSSSDDEFNYENPADALSKKLKLMKNSDSEEEESKINDLTGDDSVEKSICSSFNRTETSCDTSVLSVSTPIRITNTTAKKSTRARTRKTRNAASTVCSTPIVRIGSDSEDETPIALRLKRNRRQSTRSITLSQLSSALLSSFSEMVSPMETRNSRGRGRNRGRGRGSRRGRGRGRNRTNEIENDGQVLNISTVEIPDSDEEVKETNDPHIDDDVNYECSVKVWWRFLDIKRFTIRRFQKLTSIFEFYHERENIPIDQLIFILKEKIIKPSDTPDSLDIDAGSIIEGGILTKEQISENHSSEVNRVGKNNKRTHKKDEIELKIQSKDRKKPFYVNLNKNDCLNVVMAKVSEELEIGLDKLKFYFDGEIIKNTDSPKTLDLEGGECIDVCVKT